MGREQPFGSARLHLSTDNPLAHHPALLACAWRYVVLLILGEHCHKERSPPILTFSLRAGQNLFLHHQTPGLFAHVCGMIVGVQPKDDHVAYERKSPHCFPHFAVVLITHIALFSTYCS